MIIKDYEQGDEVAILKLFNQAFQKDMSLDYWKWRFEHNPSGKHFIKLIWLDGLLIGHFAVSPVKMHIFGKTERAALAMTVMTHPDHSGKGVFNKIVLNMLEDLENKRNFKVVWGFPNKNSHYRFIKNIGWENVGVVHSLFLHINDIDPAESPDIIAGKQFSEKHGNKLSGLSSDFDIFVLKDEKYLNWRYIMNPSQDYTVFDYDDGKQNGFIVTKIYPSNIKPGVYDLYIMELGLGKNQLELLNVMIKHAATYYKVKFDRVNIWLNLWDKRHLVLEKMGFILGDRSTFLITKNNTGHKNTLELKRWSYSFGDSDVY